MTATDDEGGGERTPGPTYHRELVQGTDEWLQARCGLLTASEMKLILTPTLKVASNDKERAHLYELLAQRITGRVEDRYQSDDMLRGHAEEAEARYLYEQRYAPVDLCGFVTNDRWGFTLGCSPDGLVRKSGAIECKSRKAKYQIETICSWKVPDEHVIQVQSILLITEREWLDFLSYSNGMHMVKIPVEPDPIMHEAILEAASQFEKRLSMRLSEYRERLAANSAHLIPTVYSPPAGEMYV